MDNQKISITGEITAKAYNQKSLNKLQRLWNKFVIYTGLDKKKWYVLGDLIWIDVKKNIICNVGLNAICKRLDGDNTYTGKINYMALGTGTPVVVAVGDIKLATESYRNLTASGTDSANVVYLTAYYTETEVSGTFYEFGNFIDGTGSADSGKLWSHITCSWVKDAVTVVVVDCKYTFASV